MYKKFFLTIVCICVVCSFLQAQNSTVPGIVISHVPQTTGCYIGSPSICIMPNGDYIASHDLFGPQSDEFKSAHTWIFKSSDKGKTWEKTAEIIGQFWSTIFNVGNDVYIIGTNKHHGNFVIRKSTDEGVTWTIPYLKSNGLLLEGEYHTAPTPMLVHQGRIWRALEYATASTTAWGKRYSACMLSAPIGCDLLNADNWTRSNPVYYNPDMYNGKGQAFLEGNAVVDPLTEQVVDVLRVDLSKGESEVMALMQTKNDGKELSFDIQSFYPMPGAAKKFVILYDNVSKRYLSLVNEVPEEWKDATPSSVRNQLTLISSDDLRHWTKHAVLLQHPDRQNHAFQYISWLFDGNDIIFVSRTAYDDKAGGAHNNHDANYMTFHRIHDFRSLLSKQLP